MGALAFFLGSRWRLPHRLAIGGLTATGIVFCVLLAIGWRFPLFFGRPPLYHAGWFLSDYVFGAVMSALIFFFDQVFSKRSVSPLVANATKAAANMSFSLYCYHYPLLIFAAAVVPFEHQSAVQALGVASLVLLVVAALSRYTEARRPVLHRWIEKLAARMFGPAGRLPASEPSSTSLR